MVPPRRNSTYKPSLLSTQQMSKCAVGCHLWMKRGNREKPQDIVVSEGKTAEIRAKMGCVFRTGKWFLIDIRRKRGWFWGVWKGFLTEYGWGAEKIERIYGNRTDFNWLGTGVITIKIKFLKKIRWKYFAWSFFVGDYVKTLIYVD